jgi:hypothetical protein
MSFSPRVRVATRLAFSIPFAVLPMIGSVRAADTASPRAYCAKVINDDELRGVPPSLAGAIKKLFHVSGTYAAQTTRYRCADGKVMLCNEGANLPCGKANLGKSLPGATAWCKDNPNSDFIPMVATGHDTIYNWRCANGVATPGGPIGKVDSRGFFVEYWKPLR